MVYIHIHIYIHTYHHIIYIYIYITQLTKQCGQIIISGLHKCCLHFLNLYFSWSKPHFYRSNSHMCSKKRKQKQKGKFAASKSQYSQFSQVKRRAQDLSTPWLFPQIGAVTSGGSGCSSSWGRWKRSRRRRCWGDGPRNIGFTMFFPLKSIIWAVFTHHLSSDCFIQEFPSDDVLPIIYQCLAMDCHVFYRSFTLWLFDIAMEHGHL